MTRVSDWQKLFWDYLTAARLKDFKWGSHDCVGFATSCADAIAGTDYYARMRAQFSYSTEAEAHALIEQHGGLTGLVKLITGLDPVNWGQLGLGDVVLVAPFKYTEPVTFAIEGESIVNAEPIVTRSTRNEMLCVHDGHSLIGPQARPGPHSRPHRHLNDHERPGGLAKIPFQYAVHGWRI